MAQATVARVRIVLMAAALAALLLPLAATAATGPSGTWIGKMKTAEGEEFEIRLVLDGAGSSWTGELSDPYMGKLELENLRVTATRVGFTFRPANAPIPAHFSGNYLAAKDRITGTFSMRGTSRFVQFLRDPSSLGLGGPAAPIAPAEPTRVRHDYNFAVTGRLAWWPSLHVVKDETYNLNTLTKSAPAFDVAAKWFILDGFSLYGRYYRGGQGIVDDQVKLDAYPGIGLTADSYLKMDGWEVGITGYLGPVIMPDSRFNPYGTIAVGQCDWALQTDGRGSDTILLDRAALEGSDPAVAVGLGTEYELSSRMVLEFEWAWRYVMSEDDMIWEDPDTTWSNAHAWALSLGLTFGF